MKRIIIDTDPGVDDALAILMALSYSDAEILGMVSVAGNVPASRGARNIIRLLDAYGAPPELYARVYEGSSKPLVRKLVTAEWVHGRDGLGDAGLPEASREPKRGGVRFLLETLESASKGEISLLCIGPLTNIALLALLYPDASKRIGEVVIMGGWFAMTGFSSGNATPVSEFNIYNDPEAAHVVFESFGEKVWAVGLDVTTHPEGLLTWEEWKVLNSSPSRAGKIAARVTERTLRVFNGSMGLHDPLAFTALVKPGLFEFKRYPVLVSLGEGATRGQVIVDKRGWLEAGGSDEEAFPYIREPQIQVAVDIRAREARDFIVGLLSS
ncbi:MAG: nucleoside hydrolase [Infirmifilum sp.]